MRVPFEQFRREVRGKRIWLLDLKQWGEIREVMKVNRKKKGAVYWYTVRLKNGEELSLDRKDFLYEYQTSPSLPRRHPQGRPKKGADQ